MKDDFKKRLIINTAIAAGIILAIIAATVFVRIDLSGRVARIKEFKQQLAFRSQALKSFAILGEEARRANQYKGFLDNILPTSDELIRIPDSFKKIAEQNKIPNLGFSFGSESPGGTGQLGFTDFKMTVNGPKESFVSFLKGIEASNYFIGFSNINFTKDGPRFASEFSGRAYSK